MHFADFRRPFDALSRPLKKSNGSDISGTQSFAQTNFKLSRHDPHNLELKSNFKLEGDKVAGQFQLFLFLPLSVHLNSYTKTELKEDFHSRARLAIPKKILHGESAIPREIQYFRSILEAYRSSDSASFSIVLADHVFEATRRIGAILGEALKSQGNLVQKKLLLSFSLLSKNADALADIDQIKSTLLKITAHVDEIHTMTSRPEFQELPVISLLNQYINQLYIEFLGSIREHVDLISDEKRASIVDLETLVKGLQEKVLNSEGTRVDPALLTTEDEERERYLLKRSQLKKFFQSEMFIEVAKQEVIKKYSEPAAIVGASLACLGVLAPEQIGLSSHAGVKGASLICLGMLLYVMKDRFRNYFTLKIGKVVPDHERVLTAEGKKFGVVQEWFSVKKIGTLPALVRELRLKCCLSEAEKHLPEDILHYKRKFEIRSDLASQFKDNQRSLHEIVRINLQRYLKHMDDAYKGLLFLDSEGNFSKRKSHRIYHFYACLVASQSNASSKSLEQPLDTPLFSKMYRIVMDKNGIVRVETI